MEQTKIYLNNARNCLRIFLRDTNIKELWCPYKICNVVFKAARQENVRLRFYHIDKKFYPTKEFNKDDYILYPNYFGICDFQAEQLAKRYPNLIYDASQSLYSKPLGIATIYSPRKFLPVADGGILIAKKDINIRDLPTENNTTDFSTNPASFEYEKFLKNELRFNRSDEIKLISPKSKSRLESIDFEEERILRVGKYCDLHKRLYKYNDLELPELPYSPMVYPLKTTHNEIIEEFLKQDITYLQYDYMKDIFPIPLN